MRIGEVVDGLDYYCIRDGAGFFLCIEKIGDGGGGLRRRPSRW